jgi:DNA-directed RNA polymerase subunit beta'
MEQQLTNTNSPSQGLSMGASGAPAPQAPLLLGASDTTVTSFDSVRISVASPDQIRSWSFGEVKKPETINYRTFKPERDGLFCARIFGPIKDYECICGKYRRMKYRGVVCERCGVEVTLAKVRRERMGHIELASPVAHIWFSRSLPSRIGNLLDMSNKNLDRILYFDGYVVLDPGMTPLEYCQILGEDELIRVRNEYGRESFRMGSGAEALKEILCNLNLEELCQDLRHELLDNPSELRRKKIVKRLKLAEAFLGSKTRPEWMILDVIPVMPPELRPLVPLDGGRFATSDLNDLYRRLLNRNNRLKRLIELQAPEMIIRNEKRMLQEIVDAFFDNGRRGRPITGSNKRPLKSLSDMLKGKQGRFRLNLLGKRVDYSGRSVIVVGPELKLNQCGLPKKMALELFKPFVYSRLERYGFANTIKAAKRMVERERPEVWDVLEEVIKERTVLLNRAPTLHRLSIQAFEPMLVEGKAIKLHPLVCAAYNADFDGDQMAVHVPLSLEAQIEARVLMMATNNILSPSSGEPVIVPSKDIVLGLYYLTLMREKELGQGRIFADLNEVLVALHQKEVSLHAKIIARHPVAQEDGTLGYQRCETSPGRLILWDIVPKHVRITFDYVNAVLTSKDVAKLVGLSYRYCGSTRTVEFADALVQLGFRYATQSGISFGKDDLIIPDSKTAIVQETQRAVNEYHQNFLDGLITGGERYNKVTDAWTKCTERVAEAMMVEISRDTPGTPLNSVYMMAHSGARGSAAQMRQLAAMRGLIARHDGSIIEHPIISNFKEGLKPLEYFNSTHGSRKGLSDTALKTANAGYLTRRLVDVAQDCVIYSDNCGTTLGVTLQAIVEGGGVIASLSDRIVGRVSSEDIQINGSTIFPGGQMIEEADVDRMVEAGVTKVKVRSVLTCQAAKGVCAQCYGRDLGRGRLVTVGEAVGVIAAQSIGEPGTQLTLRTFHSGGAAQRGSEVSFLEALKAGSIALRNAYTIVNRMGQQLVLSRNLEIVLLDTNGNEAEVYRVPFGAVLLVGKGDLVEAGQKLAEWDPYTIPVIAESDGVVHYVDLIDGISLREVTDEFTGITQNIVMDWKQGSRMDDLRPSLVMRTLDGKALKLESGGDARHELAVDAVVMVSDGKEVHKGDVLARMAKEVFKSRDITGGLPRIAELFEARRPKEPAVMCQHDGVVEFGKDHKTRRRLVVIPNDPAARSVEYLITKGRHVLVQEGDHVKKGDILVDGNPVPHDILMVLGVEPLAQYLIKELQDVYRLQGVRINDKHIEVIIRQMLRKVEVVRPGETTFLEGDQISQDELNTVNDKAVAEGRVPAQAIPVLQGITKASLKTDSFISAASFQETTRVLIEAAIWGKEDPLIGLKENVIAGRLIPAGTGFVVERLRALARERDLDLLDHARQDQGALALGPSHVFASQETVEPQIPAQEWLQNQVIEEAVKGFSIFKPDLDGEVLGDAGEGFSDKSDEDEAFSDEDDEEVGAQAGGSNDEDDEDDNKDGEQDLDDDFDMQDEKESDDLF